jgi:hypothetical protein
MLLSLNIKRCALFASFFCGAEGKGTWSEMDHDAKWIENKKISHSLFTTFSVLIGTNE